MQSGSLICVSTTVNGLLWIYTMYSVSQKNDIDVAHRNSDADQPILVIFGGDVAERAYYQILFVIPPLLANVSALPGETWNPEIVSFQSWCKLCLKNKMAR